MTLADHCLAVTLLSGTAGFLLMPVSPTASLTACVICLASLVVGLVAEVRD